MKLQSNVFHLIGNFFISNIKEGTLIGKKTNHLTVSYQKDHTTNGTISSLTPSAYFLEASGMLHSDIYKLSRDKNTIIKKESFNGRGCIVCLSEREDNEEEVDELIKICECANQFYILLQGNTDAPVLV
eukprot:GHVP01061725.1.p1 GENE.GHVP01061725.1~~GHVP01061725.1.p1  ORF type:complete len:129 (-),score=14.39 GHVP01061725.1:73-459(-)